MSEPHRHSSLSANEYFNVKPLNMLQFFNIKMSVSTLATISVLRSHSLLDANTDKVIFVLIKTSWVFLV